MELRPCFDQPALTRRQTSSDQCQRIDGEDPDIILVIGMKVRAMMWGTWLREHANDDPEEPGKLGHRLVD